jgi:hypothetical protein
VKRPFLTVSPCVYGCDLWTAGTGNTIRWIWHAPKWLSFGSYFSTRRL